MKTLQEAFDTVLEGLREQAKRSEDGGVCAYRSYQDDGTCLKCGIGFLIDDVFIDETMNELRVIAPEVKLRLEKSGYPVSREYSDFYIKIQDIHDLYSLTSWEGKFKELAEKWDLEYTPDPKFRLSPVKLAGKED